MLDRAFRYTSIPCDAAFTSPPVPPASPSVLIQASRKGAHISTMSRNSLAARSISSVGRSSFGDSISVDLAFVLRGGMIQRNPQSDEVLG